VNLIFIRAILDASGCMDVLKAERQFEELRQAILFAGAMYRETTTSVIRECEMVARNSDAG
jgi:hypothetical protein